MVVGLVLFALAVIGLIGTAVDYCYRQPRLRRREGDDKKEKHRDSFLTQMLVCSSLYTNGNQILDTEQKPGSINCIHGIRFISMTWVIMGHVFDSAGGSDNVYQIFDLTKYFLNQAIANAYYSVDTFFLISGLLMGYLWFKDAKTAKATRKPMRVLGANRWALFYLHRWIRLTPVYALVLAAYTAYLPYFTSGPYWQQNTTEVTNCEKNYWTNVLYINNLVDVENMCYGVSWYMANDMQFHLFVPLVLAALFFSPLGGLVLSTLLILASIGANFAVTIHFHLIAENIFGAPKDPRAGPDGDLKYFQYNYYAPYIRFPPYLIGILVGTFMQLKFGRGKAKIPYLVNAVGWIIATALACGAIFGLYDYSQGHQLDVGWRAAYSALGRPAWAIAIAWLIFACHNGYGGPVNRFLSWTIFIPLSKLTYCAYLLHVFLYYIMLANTSQPLHWDGTGAWILLHMVPLCTFSFIVAFFVSAWLELPFMKLEMLLLKGGGGNRVGRRNDQPTKEQNGKAPVQANGIQPAWEAGDQKDVEKSDTTNDNVARPNGTISDNNTSSVYISSNSFEKMRF